MHKLLTPPAKHRHVWRGAGLSLVLSPRALAICSLMALLLAALAVGAMMQGKLQFTPTQILDALFGPTIGSPGERIILNIRLPRVVTAIFVGAALGVSGAVFQSISNNALGSPDVIGFTTGAATGAIGQIILFNPDAMQVMIAAVVGGVATALLVYLLALKSGAAGGYRLILTGIGVGTILTALNSLMLSHGHLDEAMVANLWLAGSLHARTWSHALPIMAGVLILVPVILLGARRLTLMEMGDDLARQLGINVERVRLSMVFCAVLLAALATGAAGPIAFIALAAPQLAIRLLRARNLPIIGTALMGACLLLLADLITQLLPLSFAIPIGRMTGIIGGMYLIWLLTRSRQV